MVGTIKSRSLKQDALDICSRLRPRSASTLFVILEAQPRALEPVLGPLGARTSSGTSKPSLDPQRSSQPSRTSAGTSGCSLGPPVPRRVGWLSLEIGSCSLVSAGMSAVFPGFPIGPTTRESWSSEKPASTGQTSMGQSVNRWALLRMAECLLQDRSVRAQIHLCSQRVQSMRPAKYTTGAFFVKGFRDVSLVNKGSLNLW
jgi:hypothetical protein